MLDTLDPVVDPTTLPSDDIAPPSTVEVDAAETWLLATLATRGALRLPLAMKLSGQAGHRWRAVIAARRRAKIGASRGEGGEFIWRRQA